MQEAKTVKITEGFDEGQKCFIIETASAKYYFQQESGGFSSIHDREGIDWINFKATSYGMPGDAGGTLRGIPNMVWPDNIGHPGYKKVKSVLEEDNKITSSSSKRLWQWQCSFFDDNIRFDVIKTPPKRQYWFLYQGTQGGRFAPYDSFWGTDKHGRRHDTPICHKGDPPPFHDYWKAVYFGLKDVPRVLYIIINEEKAPYNLYSYMGSADESLKAPDGMTVFGFGRGPGPKPLLEGQTSFIMGFLETTDHEDIIQHIKSLQ